MPRKCTPKARKNGFLTSLTILLLFDCPRSIADEEFVLNNGIVQVSAALSGGGITEFRFLDHAVNPLNWEMRRDSAFSGKPYLRGHFLCLDRWGAPSEAEAENGMTFHGEAAYASWRLVDRRRISRKPSRGRDDLRTADCSNDGTAGDVA